MLRDQMITKGISTDFCNKLARKFLVKGKNKLIVSNSRGASRSSILDEMDIDIVGTVKSPLKMPQLQ